MFAFDLPSISRGSDQPAIQGDVRADAPARNTRGARFRTA